MKKEMRCMRKIIVLITLLFSLSILSGCTYYDKEDDSTEIGTEKGN